jgi:galactonate dehydratase
MKVIKIETIRYAPQPNILWVRLHSDNGLIGLGETFYLPSAVEAIVHDSLAGFVLGQPAFEIERIWDEIFSYCNFFGFAGAEMRALSAIDIALWDLAAQQTGQPVHNLMGGRTRDHIPVYNTCVNSPAHADYDAFMERPGQLAKSLLGNGIKAMKIWPFDRFAPQFKYPVARGPAGYSAMGPSGAYLSSKDLEAGLGAVSKIRDSVGKDIDIMIEGHCRWDLNCAIRIAKALEPFDVRWMEDIIKPESASDLARLVSETRVPQCVSERLFTRYAFREVLEARAAHVIMPDLIWTGGLTEGRKIAILADTYHLPIAPHDCTGLVTLFANLHLCAASTNAMILETVRGYYEGWYRDVYTENVQIQDGMAAMPSAPGIGTALKKELLADPQTSIRVTAGSNRSSELKGVSTTPR